MTRNQNLGGGALRAFSYPQFRVFWAASFLSFTTFFMVMVSRGWLVFHLTGSPFQATAVNAVAMLPMFGFPIFGGVIADRFNRRTILMIGEASNFIFLFALAVALFIWEDNIEIWLIFLLSALNGVSFAVAMPARNASVPSFVGRGDLANGVALFSTLYSISQLTGPAMVGYLIDWSGPGTTFLVASLVTIPATLMLLPLRMPQPAGGHISSGSILGNIAEGWTYTCNSPALVGLMLLGIVISVFGIPYQSIMPVMVEEVLDSGPARLGLLTACVGVGGLLGAFAVAFFSSARHLKSFLYVGGLGMAATIILFAASNIFYLSLAIVIVLGFMTQLFFTSSIALVHLHCPDQIRGRVLGIRMIIIGLGPFGMLLLGLGAELVDPQLSLGVMGAIGLVLIAIIGFVVPELRHVEVGLVEQEYEFVEEAPAVPAD